MRNRSAQNAGNISIYEFSIKISGRVRIDPPDKKTNYTHIHIMDENKNPLDINGNIVSPKDPSGHIPYND